MNGTTYFNDLAGKLLTVSDEGGYYRQLLEKQLGFSLHNYLVSAAEHVAPFNVSSTLSFLLPFSATAHQLNQNIKLLILPGSLIPLNNAHQPRGLQVPGYEKRINFFPKKYQHASPLLLEPANVPAFLAALEKPGLYRLRAVFDTKKKYPNFAFQLCDYMMGMYRNFFTDPVVPELKIIPFEYAAAHVLETLLQKDDPFVNSLLLNKDCRSLIYRLLHGVYCAWGEDKGSFLFWWKKGNQVERLKYNEAEDILECDDISIKFEKDEILELIKSGNILPGVFLCFMMTSYLPNIPFSGGPKQYRYYAAMIRAANELMIVKRSELLSNPGYMDFRPETISPGIPAKGTGAYLVQNKISINDISASLKHTQNNILI